MESTYNLEKEKGINVTIHAIFARHGEKVNDPNSSETGLSPEGETGTLAFGRTREKEDMIKSYSSDTPRTKDSGKNIVKSSPTEKKGDQRKKQELAFICDLNGDFYKEAMRIKAGVMISKENFESLTEEERVEKTRIYEDRQANYYISFGERRPDPETYSPVETAAKIAQLVEHYIKMSAKLNSGSSVDLINDTHDFNMISFLSQVLVLEKDGKKKTGFSSVEEIGGATKYAEAFEIIIHRNEIGEKSMKLLFRGKEWEMDMEHLEELVKLSKDITL